MTTSRTITFYTVDFGAPIVFRRPRVISR